MIVNFVFPIHSIARRRLPARLSAGAAGAALTRAGQHMTQHNASAISDSPPEHTRHTPRQGYTMFMRRTRWAQRLTSVDEGRTGWPHALAHWRECQCQPR